MNKWLEIIIGLVLVCAAAYVCIASLNWTLWGFNMNFGHAALEFLKGGLIWFVIMIGLVLILLGISDLRE